MASIHPVSWTYDLHPNELSFARTLQERLPSDWHVIAAMPWVRPANMRKGQAFGEIDFLVLTPKGVLHCVELKVARDITEKADDLIVGASGSKPKSVSRQLRENTGAVVEGLRSAGLKGLCLVYWLVLRAFSVRNATCGLPRANIVDRSAGDDPYVVFCDRILAHESKAETQQINREDMLPLIRNEVGLVPAVDTFSDDEMAFVTQHLEREELLSSISTESGIVVIDGCAGSGKTQLALQLARNAAGPVCLVTNTVALSNNLASHLSAPRYWPDSNAFFKRTSGGPLLVGRIGDVLRLCQYELIKRDWGGLSRIIVEEADQVDRGKLTELLTYSADTAAQQIFLLSDSAQDITPESNRLGPLHDPQNTRLRIDTSFRIPIAIQPFLHALNVRKGVLKTRSETEGSIYMKTAQTAQEADDRAFEYFRGLTEGADIPSQYALVSASVRDHADAYRQRGSNFSGVGPSGWSARFDSAWRKTAVIESVGSFRGFSRRFVVGFGFTLKHGEEQLRKRVYGLVTRSREHCVLFMDEKCRAALPAGALEHVYALPNEVEA